jgi:hypothetical protein
MSNYDQGIQQSGPNDPSGNQPAWTGPSALPQQVGRRQRLAGQGFGPAETAALAYDERDRGLEDDQRPGQLGGCL